MTSYLKNRYFQLALVLTIVIGLATGQSVMSQDRTNRDEQKVALMTEKMKTVCVGRFLIDLPDRAQYTLQAGLVNGFGIRVFAETEEAFNARVANREFELRHPKPSFDGKVKSFEAAKDIQISDFSGKMFVFGRDTTFGFKRQQRFEITSVEVEGYAHANGLSVNLTKSSADPDRLDELPSLLAQIKLNADNQIPTEPGFCIDRAYIREPLAADDSEQVTLTAGIPEYPDLAIMLDMTANGAHPPEDLLARTKRINDGETLERLARIKDLGAGNRVINGIPGEQSLEGYHESNSTTGYLFVWESPSIKDNVFRPSLYFELQTGANPQSGGKPVQSSLSEKAVLALWDKISSSIRVRPTEAPKVSVAEPPLPPLGTMASAGDICPQTGWWLCGDGGGDIGVLGGQRQYIKQGQRMPQALLLPPQTLMEKMRGLQPSYESATPTTWKLVDKRGSGRTVPSVPLAEATPASPSDATITTEQQAAIGTLAATGNKCPASGWWRCEEANALDGTRWFAQGSLLPAVTLTVPTAVFSRWRGAPRTARRDGIWRLVRFAVAPEPESGNRGPGEVSS